MQGVGWDVIPEALCVLAVVLLVTSIKGRAVGLRWDFEDDQEGEVPRDWSARVKGYCATVVGEGACSGERCVVLAPDPEVDEGARSAPFGTLTHRMPAGDFAYSRVRFAAALRVEGDAATQAQLWLNAVLPGRRWGGFFGDTRNCPAVDSEWAQHEVVGVIQREAEWLTMGVKLCGEGKVWVDDVSLEVLGECVEPEIVDPPRPLTASGLENVAAFARLLGLVRIFHPSDEGAATDWDTFAVEGARQVERARDAGELGRILADLFRPVAPMLRVFENQDGHPAVPDAIAGVPAQGAVQVVHWEHKGWGLGESSGRGGYESRRVRRDVGADGAPSPADPFVAYLGGGVSCMLPVALYADEDGTLPHSRPRLAQKPHLPFVRHTANDRATRLAAVALTWSVLRYFYPYFDVVDTDWDAALEPALVAAATDAGERPFLRTLRRLIAQLHDGHGGVFHGCDEDAWRPAVLLRWVEGRVCVAASDGDRSGGVAPGDVVIEIDGRPIDRLVAETAGLVSAATPQYQRHRIAEDLLLGPEGSHVALQLRSADGAAKHVSLVRDCPRDGPAEPSPDVICELEPGVMYVDINRVGDGEFAEAIPQLKAARGIIFDLRDYPRGGMRPIQHLTEETVNSSQWHFPLVDHPSPEQASFESTDWSLEPETPPLEGRAVFLIDGQAISYAETYLGIIEHYRLAEIVGQPTAGTNGNCNYMEVPDWYRVMWTGLKVLKQDGSRHHGVGILPTVPASPTIRGIAEGRDEVLERAMEVLKAKDR